MFSPFTGLQAQSLNGLQLNFRQDYNTYIWQSNFIYTMPYNIHHRLSVNEVYRANLLETVAQSDKWKDDNQVFIDYQYRFKPWLSASLRMKSTVFSDRQTGFINNYNTHVLDSGLFIKPKKMLQIQAAVGVKSDKRYNRSGNGLHYLVATQANPFQIAEYTNQFLLNLNGDNFDDRHNQDFALQYNINRHFYENTADSLSYRFGYRKKMYYISETGDLESRAERENHFFNRLDYRISEQINWYLKTRIYTRSSSVDQIVDENSVGSRQRQDTGIHWESYLDWQSEKLQSGIGWIYNSQSQDFQTSQAVRPSPFIGSLGLPDNKSHTYTLRSFARWQFSRRDSLSANFSLSRFQYDTPDTNNVDDRDEFRTSFVIGYHHFFSQKLEVGVEANANLHHLIYIFAEKSANNNWNRIAQLAATMRYSPSATFKWRQRAEVLANYTSYDFEEEQLQIRSYVYRRFALTDSLTFGSPKNIQFILHHRLELEENGRLFWHDFSEQLLLNRQNHYLTTGIHYRLFDNFFVYSGFTGYIRREWRYKQNQLGQLVREKWGDFISYGPQIRLYLSKNHDQQGIVSYSRLQVQTPTNQKYYINQVNLHASWYF